ncbi:MAG: DUF1549 domain-containing protein [Planctomycetaceae bacterium]|nr:DUF1549 domain-containing protein [Planctomycetaceae bacterium]
MRVLHIFIPILMTLAGLIPCDTFADEISFRNDVMAVFAKAGCNQGVCHGNKFGKGGFLLSLRGQDPSFDFLSVTREFDGRRINTQDPAQSLLLLKPTMQVEHLGGKRFQVDSLEYQILLRWLEADAPHDAQLESPLAKLDVQPAEKTIFGAEGQVQLRATACFSDGTTRDVTRLAVYEPVEQIVTVTVDGIVQQEAFGETTVIVRYLDRQLPVRLAFLPDSDDSNWNKTPSTNIVDDHVFAKLKQLRLNPAPPASDEVFLRRAFLDLIGLLPTSTEARQFVSDDQPDKREQLIDELLDRQEYADFWALKWSDLLRNEEKSLDRKGVENFHQWIKQAFAENMPMDRFVRELISSRGSTYHHPAANYYRALRDPLTRAESSAQLFLGIRLQCAKCHNHPFDRWTQDDYYGWANLFSQVNYKLFDNTRKDRLDKNEFIGEQVVYMLPKGNVTHAQTGQSASSRFLGDTEIAVDDDADRLLQLSDWIVSQENRQFARSQVNRIWYQLIGRGIVEPIDDFRITNPPSNPALLEALTDYFIESGFDVRAMIHLIMNSQTYQASLGNRPVEPIEVENYARPVVRRLSAEQILDAVSQVTGQPVSFNGFPAGMRASQLPGVRAIRPRDQQPSPGDQFLVTFGKPQRLQTCECERSNETTLSQTFQMVSGPLMNELLSGSATQIELLISSGRSVHEIIVELYWTTLTRAPTNEEINMAIAHCQEAADSEPGLEDLLWALVNSNEFLLRH